MGRPRNSSLSATSVKCFFTNLLQARTSELQPRVSANPRTPRTLFGESRVRRNSAQACCTRPSWRYEEPSINDWNRIRILFSLIVREILVLINCNLITWMMHIYIQLLIFLLKTNSWIVFLLITILPERCLWWLKLFHCRQSLWELPSSWDQRHQLLRFQTEIKRQILRYLLF
jgi:hypothetical protein